MSAIKGIIFDVDQTLTADVSWTKFTRLLGADPEVHMQIYNRFKAGKLTYPVAKKKLLDLWQATGKANIYNVKAIFRSFEFNPGTLEIINYLKAKGYKLCLISGAIDTYIETVAERLQLKEWYASTKLYFDAEGRISDFDYKLGRGEDKLKFFEEFCRNNNLRPEECAAIGDGDSDMPIFEQVALPVLFVVPETSAAQKQQIKVQITSLKELIKVFK